MENETTEALQDRLHELRMLACGIAIQAAEIEEELSKRGLTDCDCD